MVGFLEISSQFAAITTPSASAVNADGKQVKAKIKPTRLSLY
jgi:hypothetical protein